MEKRKIVVVSGGSRGLGEAIIRRLLKQQYRVATFSRGASPFINEMMDRGAQRETFHWEAVDAADFGSLKAFVGHVTQRFGPIDALINNAGIQLDQLITLSSQKGIDDILAVNLASIIHLTRYVTKSMLQKRNGVILNISSILGARGFKGVSVYSATKAALNGLTRSLARELGQRGIRVNSILPGFMETEMTRNMNENRKAQIVRRTPLGRLGRVEDLTGLITYLLSSEANFITGQGFVVDGGLTC